MPQNGQVLLRLESFAVQPAMTSSSYTRQSHVLQREQLDISTYIKQAQDKVEMRMQCSAQLLQSAPVYR